MTFWNSYPLIKNALRFPLFLNLEGNPEMIKSISSQIVSCMLKLCVQYRWWVVYQTIYEAPSFHLVLTGMLFHSWSKAAVSYATFWVGFGRFLALLSSSSHKYSMGGGGDYTEAHSRGWILFDVLLLTRNAFNTQWGLTLFCCMPSRCQYLWGAVLLLFHF